MQKILKTSLGGLAILVFVISIGVQLEQAAYADVMMSNVTVSCGLHCVTKKVTPSPGIISPIHVLPK